MSLRTPVALSLSLLLALTMLTVGPAATRAAQQDESIPSDFQVYVCPEGYTRNDYLNDCFPAAAGDFSITVTDTSPTEPTATTKTADDGFIQFATLPGPTSWVLNAGGPSSFYVSCFDGNGVYLFDAASDLVAATLDEGDALACRWYVTPASGSTSGSDEDRPPDPEDATIAVQVFDCPEGYDGDDYAADCPPTTRPVGITLNDGRDYDESSVIRVKAGDHGQAKVIQLQQGDYFLAVEDLSETSTIVHACTDVTSNVTSEGSEVYGSQGTHNRVRLFLQASYDLSCQIFLTANGPKPPEPGSAGTVTLSVLSCEEGYHGPDWSTACTNSIDSSYAYLFDPSDPESSGYGDPAAGAEIYEGTAILEDVPSGDQRVTTGIPGHGADFAAGCVTGPGPVSDDAIRVDGNLVNLAEGEGATCVIYITWISFRT